MMEVDSYGDITWASKWLIVNRNPYLTLLKKMSCGGLLKKPFLLIKIHTKQN